MLSSWAEEGTEVPSHSGSHPLSLVRARIRSRQSSCRVCSVERQWKWTQKRTRNSLAPSCFLFNFGSPYLRPFCIAGWGERYELMALFKAERALDQRESWPGLETSHACLNLVVFAIRERRKVSRSSPF